MEYSRATKRASYAVSYYHNSTVRFGLIHYFIEARIKREHDYESVLAVIHVLHTEPVVTVHHLYEAEETEIFQPVPVTCIVEKCVVMKTDKTITILYLSSTVAYTQYYPNTISPRCSISSAILSSHKRYSIA